jgi:hypothetical protein
MDKYSVSVWGSFVRLLASIKRLNHVTHFLDSVKTSHYGSKKFVTVNNMNCNCHSFLERSDTTLTRIFKFL